MKESKVSQKNEVSPNKPSNEVAQQMRETHAKNPEIAREIKEIRNPIQNKIEGMAREAKVQQELENKYSESKGYKIHCERYLRNDKREIVKDPETGQARKVDFMVEKNGKIEKSVEVTSQSAPKDMQMAKEQRIRDAGGNYIKTNDGRIIEIKTKTEIWRRL